MYIMLCRKPLLTAFNHLCFTLSEASEGLASWLSGNVPKPCIRLHAAALVTHILQRAECPVAWSQECMH